MTVAINPTHLKIVSEILTAHLPANARIWVFGSRSRGSARRSSDLDLAIDAGQRLTLRETGLLADAFDEALLPYRVDIVDVHSITPEFRDRIEPDFQPLPQLTEIASLTDDLNGPSH